MCASSMMLPRESKHPWVYIPRDFFSLVPMEFQRILVDVDTQVDFLLPEGALYVPAPAAVREHITRLTQAHLPRIGSVDSHAYDAFEFTRNGGPFPPHCVKGTTGWLKPDWARPEVLRFVPMARDIFMGEAVESEGNRAYSREFFAEEVRSGVSVYFEKEVYSLFANPFAEDAIAALVAALRATGKEPIFSVYGYCTGGFCVDAAAAGLADRGYTTELILDATAPLTVKGTLEETTLADMRTRGVRIVTTTEILG